MAEGRGGSRLEVDGRFFMGVLGCDLAHNAIERQTHVSHTLKVSRQALKCDRPALVVVAVEPGAEDDAVERIGKALGGLRGE